MSEKIETKEYKNSSANEIRRLFEDSGLTRKGYRFTRIMGHVSNQAIKLRLLKSNGVKVSHLHVLEGLGASDVGVYPRSKHHVVVVADMTKVYTRLQKQSA
jgi:hypothetical protein